MSETVIVLSSGDEAETEQEFPKKVERKRHIEDTQEKIKKRRLQAIRLGDIPKNEIKEEIASARSASPEVTHETVFNEFIGTCLELDNSSNMKKVVEKKLKKYYSLLVPEYRSSEQFITLLERKRAEMQRGPSQRFMHLKEVVDELNAHRTDKMQSSSEGKTSDRFVRKLCKAMELIYQRIKKLEEREVDWDDDNDSSYIQLQRYRERLIKVHEKINELEGNSSSGFRRKISFQGTPFPKMNRAIERFVNAKGEFPDYHDIHDLLKKSYEAEGIHMSSQKLKCEAKSVFQSVGEQLQKLRRNEFWEAHSTFLLEQEQDPADENDCLRRTLDENKKVFHKSIDEIINTYAEKPSKAQFASEEENNSNEAEALKTEKQEDSNVEENDEEEDEDDDGDEDEGGEENAAETMDDILNAIEEEEPVAHSSKTDENMFLYCGPVSPPTPLEENSNGDSLSPLPSPGFGANFLTKNEDEENNSKLQDPELSSDFSIVEEKSADEQFASCSTKQDESEVKHKKHRSSEIKEEPSFDSHERELSQNNTNKGFIKVRSLSSLQKPTSISIPEEILLD